MPAFGSSPDVSVAANIFPVKIPVNAPQFVQELPCDHGFRLLHGSGVSFPAPRPADVWLGNSVTIRLSAYRGCVCLDLHSPKPREVPFVCQVDGWMELVCVGRTSSYGVGFIPNST